MKQLVARGARLRGFSICALVVFLALLVGGVAHGFVHAHEHAEEACDCLLAKCVALPTIVAAPPELAIAWVYTRAEHEELAASLPHSYSRATHQRGPPAALLS